jgi:hypothetical protein
MGHFGEVRGYEYTFYVLAGILSISLVVAFFFMPSHINYYKTALPHEAILTPVSSASADRVSAIQAAPIHGIAQRYSIDMVKVAQKSVRYSRRSDRMM